nr:MAG TPA: hypothetical protein [Caudoviricetes sp.]
MLNRALPTDICSKECRGGPFPCASRAKSPSAPMLTS